MSELTKGEEIALREYAEAGQTCRWYEQLARVSVTIYVLFVTGLISLLQYNEKDNEISAALLFVGSLVSFIILNAIFRQRAYFASYISTAKNLEAKLGMTLYTKAANDIKNTKTFSNKRSFSLIPLCGFIGFFSAFVYRVISILFNSGTTG